MKNESEGRVLVVEDDGMIAEMIENLLTIQGYTVVGLVSSGRAAVEAVERLRPDAILMDLQLPEMDGIEATRHIQATCPTPVVILTAYDDLALTTEAAEAGAGAYLIKPARGRDLARAITVARARFEEVRALDALNEDLTLRNRDLDAFAHTVAHDLKNALMPIIGLAQLLGEGLASTPVDRARQQLDVIADEGRKLGRMVDDLLLLAEVRDRDMTPRPLDMAAVVAEARSHLTLLIEQLGADITVPDTWPTVMGHAPWVIQVWINYLSNALKYGGRPPRVIIGWDVPAPPTAARFWIRDNGAGLTCEEQCQLFKPYVQLHETETEGHGLGLSIVQRIVERLEGQVGVESQPGGGCCFWFTLPTA